MPYIVKRIGTLPAVIIKFYGEYDGDYSVEIEQRLESMFAYERGPIWRILDASDFHFSFEEMWNSAAQVRKRSRWRVSDPHIRTVAVSNSDIAYLGIRVLELLNPGINIRLFRTIKEAVAYIREEIEKSQAEAAHELN